MKAIIQEEPGGKLIIREIEKPRPGKGEVLVKMKFSPINPSDLSFISGSYAELPSYPSVAGIEGSGVVVEAGSGVLAKLRLNKRVSCTKTTGNNGCWAEYMVTKASNVVPIASHIAFETAASLLVNPLTVVAFIDLAKKNKHKTIFNNAAGGALGKMMINLCNSNRINIINTVRNQKQKEDLLKIGATHVVDISDHDAQKQLEELFDQLYPSLFFDAVGGETLGQIIDIAPRNSIIMPYANLSEQKSQFDSRKLLQKNIKIEGFFLSNYNHAVGIIKVLKNIKKVKYLINNELKSDIHQIIAPEQIHQAIESYKSNMSTGKILIRF